MLGVVLSSNVCLVWTRGRGRGEVRGRNTRALQCDSGVEHYCLFAYGQGKELERGLEDETRWRTSGWWVVGTIVLKREVGGWFLGLLRADLR